MRPALLLLALSLCVAGCSVRREDLAIYKTCPHTTIWIDRQGQLWVGVVAWSDAVDPISPKANIAEVCR